MSKHNNVHHHSIANKIFMFIAMTALFIFLMPILLMFWIILILGLTCWIICGLIYEIAKAFLTKKGNRKK